MFRYDVAVIGVGRIGLPFLLHCAAKGKRVIGIDTNAELVATLRMGKMPFSEPGAQVLLTEHLRQRTIDFTGDPSAISSCRDIVLTVGTTVLPHIEADTQPLTAAIDSILASLREGHHLILRGTLVPGATAYVRKYIEHHTPLRVGQHIFLTHCPERIAEGHFFVEIETLPQIIGANEQRSAEHAQSLFESLTSKILVTTPEQAELTKIWSNIYRYANFALPNLLLIACEEWGANVFEVIEIINADYPRGGMAQPGLSAGSCLRNSFALIEERHIGGSTLLSSVWRLHESMPIFMVNQAKKHLGGTLQGCKVALLGLSFKAGSDDTRDALSEKLIRYLRRELVDLRVHDPYVQSPPETLESVLSGAELVMIATNHPLYSSPEFQAAFEQVTSTGVLLVDIWNITGSGRVFSFPKKSE